MFVARWLCILRWSSWLALFGLISIVGGGGHGSGRRILVYFRTVVMGQFIILVVIWKTLLLLTASFLLDDRDLDGYWTGELVDIWMVLLGCVVAL